MPPIVRPGEPSTEWPIMIDGIPIVRFPSTGVPLSPTPIVDYQDMLDGGGRTWKRRPFFPGVASQADRFTLSIDFASVKDDDLINLEYIRAGGDNHLVTVWRYMCIRYRLAAGIKRLYVPRRRKIAAHLYSGTRLHPEREYFANTDQLLTLAELDGDELNVTYGEGPSLADPGAGGIIIARQPDGSGLRTRGYTGMLLGDTPAGGEELVLWTFVSFECALTQPSIQLRQGMSESHSLTFVEV